MRIKSDEYDFIEHGFIKIPEKRIYNSDEFTNLNLTCSDRDIR